LAGEDEMVVPRSRAGNSATAAFVVLSATKPALPNSKKLRRFTLIFFSLVEATRLPARLWARRFLECRLRLWVSWFRVQNSDHEGGYVVGFWAGELTDSEVLIGCETELILFHS